MSIKMFKSLAIVCLPALLFGLTYTISLNASPGSGYKCNMGDLNYGETSPKCSSYNYKPTECKNHKFKLVASSYRYCYKTSKSSDYCETLKMTNLKKGTGPCQYSNTGACSRNESGGEITTGVTIYYCEE